MADFIDKNYKIPETSNYFKLAVGENTFRILSPTITGFRYFSTLTKKPVRAKEMWEVLPDDVPTGNDGSVVHFWAFAVYNYDAKRIQIMEIHQKTLQEAILTLTNNKKWGDPTKYDITITRTGAGKNDTAYTVMANPKSDLPVGVDEKYKAMNIQLELLYSGGDPFTGAKSTPAVYPTHEAAGIDPNSIPF